MNSNKAQPHIMLPVAAPASLPKLITSPGMTAPSRSREKLLSIASFSSSMNDVRDVNVDNNIQNTRESQLPSFSGESSTTSLLLEQQLNDILPSNNNEPSTAPKEQLPPPPPLKPSTPQSRHSSKKSSLRSSHSSMHNEDSTVTHTHLRPSQVIIPTKPTDAESITIMEHSTSVPTIERKQSENEFAPTINQSTSQASRTTRTMRPNKTFSGITHNQASLGSASSLTPTSARSFRHVLTREQESTVEKLLQKQSSVATQLVASGSNLSDQNSSQDAEQPDGNIFTIVLTALNQATSRQLTETKKIELHCQQMLEQSEQMLAKNEHMLQQNEVISSNIEQVAADSKAILAENLSLTQKSDRNSCLSKIFFTAGVFFSLTMAGVNIYFNMSKKTCVCDHDE